MSQTPSLEPGQVAQALGQPQQRPRLLVVDDQPVNIHALYQAFAADHQVFMATSGAQALELCVSKQPDLVLLDVVMPGMDGYEVCRRLKAESATRDIPVIFVTANNDEVAEALGLDAGAVDFITKPINPRIVRARVRTHLVLKAQSDLLRHWVYIDGLTGVPNRRHFDERLESEWRRSARDGTPLSVALLDVDFFKRYNDHYGHQSGDDCLRRVATALKSHLQRPGDLLARYGGEEFACVFPDTELSGAMGLANLLVQQIHAQQIEHVASAVAPVVTISAGVCTRPGKGSGSAAEMLQQADAQLYAAKAGGRHRACGAEIAAP